MAESLCSVLVASATSHSFSNGDIATSLLAMSSVETDVTAPSARHSALPPGRAGEKQIGSRHLHVLEGTEHHLRQSVSGRVYLGVEQSRNVRIGSRSRDNTS